MKDATILLSEWCQAHEDTEFTLHQRQVKFSNGKAVVFRATLWLPLLPGQQERDRVQCHVQNTIPTEHLDFYRNRTEIISITFATLAEQVIIGAEKQLKMREDKAKEDEAAKEKTE